MTITKAAQAEIIDLGMKRAALISTGKRYRYLRRETEDARKKMRDAIVAAARLSMSEAEIARVTGVQRETVRKALGK